MHWDLWHSHEEVVRMREPLAVPESILSAESNASDTSSFRPRAPVLLSAERPLVLDPANPTNNVAYRVSSNDPDRRAWLTISRIAQRALEESRVHCGR